MASLSGNTHACAVCPKEVTGWKLMCDRHWHRVPAELRDQVNAAWRRMNWGIERHTFSARRDYLQARQAAIDAVRPTRATPEQVKADQAKLVFTHPTGELQ